VRERTAVVGIARNTAVVLMTEFVDSVIFKGLMMSSLTKGSRKNSTLDVPAVKTGSTMLRSFPFYEEGKVPQYHEYHAKVSYLNELELIWGKRWGARGIGRLREVPCEKFAGLGRSDGCNAFLDVFF
jgi:hypothetical protein